VASLYESRREQMFPKLSAAQLQRVEAYGQRLRTHESEILTESGERYDRIVAVLSGSIDVMRPGLAGETPITQLTRGDFTGEMSALRGSASFVRTRVREAGEVISMTPENLRRLVQGDSELSELFMRAFILRRMALMQAQQGDVVLVGSRDSAATLRIRQFLSRNAVPYVGLDADTDVDAAALLEQFHVGASELPVVLCRDKVLRNPGNADMAECLGLNPRIDPALVRDLVVIGAGPAGLAAAVYAASEGLRVLVLETLGPGGQAGASSKIENYLGFPTGISGQALAGRALVQAHKFGADVLVAGTAERLHTEERPYRIEISGGRAISARTVIIATGAEYRTLPLENLDRFLGIGVYYAATHIEAQLCKDEEICVVGGGNSAGQAAVFLAGHCRKVHVLVRASGLADSMSQYLIHRIEDSPNIVLHTHTELALLEGDGHLQQVVWRSKNGESAPHAVRHVFLMTGAVPNTSWLGRCAAVDAHGFLRTGPDLRREELEHRRWPLERAPYFLETNLPGVFAVGDVRSGSMKRVAAAVGEGSACVSFVHASLRD
jgi:thioredoxin reductase (NADPH)